MPEDLEQDEDQDEETDEAQHGRIVFSRAVQDTRASVGACSVPALPVHGSRTIIHSVQDSRGPSPRAALTREVTRALGGALLLPLRVSEYLLGGDAARDELAADLAGFVPAPTAPEVPRLPERPLRIFISCAEASGEIHAGSLAGALRKLIAAARAPAPEFVGIGGARLAEQGVRVIGDPVARAAMGFDGVVSGLPFYARLLEDTARVFRSPERPDVFVPVDSPALHVPLAHTAQRYGIPVVHFIAPQYWAWAPWRVHGYRRAIDRALAILPFEPAWFERHGIPCAYVGHPLLDALADVPVHGSDGTARSLVILPGSRANVIERNLPWMLRVAQRLHAALPDAPVIVLQDDDKHEQHIAGHLRAAGGFARLALGDLHGHLGRARAALSVSGTILLDLMHHRIPAVVVYRVERRGEMWMYRHLMSAPYFASVNLLAGEEVLPEFCFRGEGPIEEIGRALFRCYNDTGWRARCRTGLDQAAKRLGPPGAADRAARHVLAVAAPRLAPGAAEAGR